jgi:hypothetical protein
MADELFYAKIVTEPRFFVGSQEAGMESSLDKPVPGLTCK